MNVQLPRWGGERITLWVYRAAPWRDLAGCVEHGLQRAGDVVETQHLLSVPLMPFRSALGRWCPDERLWGPTPHRQSRVQHPKGLLRRPDVFRP